MIEKNKNIVLRKIYETNFLVDITEDYMNNECSLMEINNTGKFIWESINGEKGSDEIAEELIDAVLGDVDSLQIKTDVKDFMEMLNQLGFIRG